MSKYNYTFSLLKSETNTHILSVKTIQTGEKHIKCILLKKERGEKK